MAEKRSKKAEEEAKEHKANEVLRRKAGKVWSSTSYCTILTFHIKDMAKMKEDLQLKEALKEAEAKKRGNGTVSLQSSQILLTAMGYQKKLKMRERRQPSKHKSKLIKKQGSKKPQRKRLSGMGNHYHLEAPNQPLRPALRLLLQVSLVKNLRKRGFKYVWLVEGSRTRRLYRAMPVR